MNICVFCSANDLDEKYAGPARELAGLIAKAGHTLVWGGSNVGLMKVMADAAQESGGKIIGISLEVYKQNARQNADEMIITQTLGERKMLFLERSDVIVTLPGGLGTLDEATEILELRKQERHSKLSIILNTDGFYDGFKMQIERIFDEGFVSHKEKNKTNHVQLPELIQFADTPVDVMTIIGRSSGQPTMEVPLDM